MNKTLSIAIIDNNKFYTAGLFMALSTHLKNKNINAEMLPEDYSNIAADVIFQAIYCGTFIAASTKANESNPFYFVITDKKYVHLKHLYQGINESNILYRNQSVNHVLQRIEDALSSQESSSKKILPASEYFIYEPLTSREHEVLFHLKKGKTPTGAAISMGINVKTISAHKRAAMKKLNFRRTCELFHWMLQGGLSGISQEKKIKNE
ncbi:two component system sensor kinase SsrB [Serratia quinivorans]|uniref:helix-turn-helix transcriptional regulator n=1 Tax=Serratia quinivorans TaxID=137545 RepID=UPI002177356B|nr:helix-turn-helix transcriptional regulator [Serratia quinivorans]CAI1839123.1 two component system sensor kinase SsrB [Serratia quinivorans]CAI1924350.1 two component system sensor kinase SsrB [Serratia quinivorans]